MNKLGLVGGTGPQSTLDYYHNINYGYQEQNNNKEFPEITIESINNSKMLNNILKGNLKDTEIILTAAVQNLINAGAKIISFTGITPHIIFDDVQSHFDIQIINMLEIVSKSCVSMKYKKPLLIGTLVTMEQPFFLDELSANGINAVLPNSEEKHQIASKILTELEQGIVTKNTKEYFLKLIEHYRATQNIDSVILGCTELPMLLTQKDSTLPLVNPVSLHIDYLINAIK